MGKVRYYGKGLPGVTDTHFNGTLIVLEGGDGAGRSTQNALLRDWLERSGIPTTQVGLRRSPLVGEELTAAMNGNELGPTTMSLFYATDFADQLEKVIIPALRAGFTVLADRYIYTLMARDILRGADPQWLKDIYGIALIPDLVIYQQVPPKVLAERNLLKDGDLDYWESGRDIERTGDIYECFVRYQSKMQNQFKSMATEYNLQVINAERDPFKVQEDIQAKVRKLIKPRIDPHPDLGSGQTKSVILGKPNRNADRPRRNSKRIQKSSR